MGKLLKLQRLAFLCNLTFNSYLYYLCLIISDRYILLSILNNINVQLFIIYLELRPTNSLPRFDSDEREDYLKVLYVMKRVL